MVGREMGLDALGKAWQSHRCYVQCYVHSMSFSRSQGLTKHGEAN